MMLRNKILIPCPRCGCTRMQTVEIHAVKTSFASLCCAPWVKHTGDDECEFVCVKCGVCIEWKAELQLNVVAMITHETADWDPSSTELSDEGIR